MAVVKFTYALKRFYPNLDDFEVQAGSVHEMLLQLDLKYPGIKNYIIDEQGVLRKHVNIFKDGTLIIDREKLSDQLESNSEVFIMQALSGG